MAATLNDITVPNDSWVSANVLSGLAVGTAMIVQPKNGYVLCQLKTSQPSASDSNGVVLQPHLLYPITSGEPTVWLRSVQTAGPVNIQQGE